MAADRPAEDQESDREDSWPAYPDAAQEGDREDSWPAYPDTPADRPSDAARTDEKVAIPATRSRVKRWGGAIAGVGWGGAIAGVAAMLAMLALAFVPLPSFGSLLWNAGRVFHVDVMPLRVYWEDVQPGMCVREDPNGMEYLVVDCNAEHEAEVTSRSTLARIGGWPGDAAVEDMAGEKCKPAFATYVGLELGQSRLDFDFATPDESGWNDLRPIPILRWPMIGRATLICLVWDPDHDQITGALRGAHE